MCPLGWNTFQLVQVKAAFDYAYMMLEGLVCKENETQCVWLAVKQKTAIYFYTVFHTLMQTNCTLKSREVDFPPTAANQPNNHRLFYLMEKTLYIEKWKQFTLHWFYNKPNTALNNT